MEIAVLYGGEGEERAVSLLSGKRVCAALRERGHRVRPILLDEKGISPDMYRLFRQCDAVFLALHGGRGEDGGLQADLEANGIYHYTGSAPIPSRLAMQKDRAKERVAAQGVPVARGAVLLPGAPLPPPPELPLVVKPLDGGSSVGLSFLYKKEEYEALCPARPMLCEAFLPGAEYSVAVLGGRALPPIEIRPRGGVYDYHHKYTDGATEEICPAPLSPCERERLIGYALTAFHALGLRDYARIDFRNSAEGVPHFLEANSLPGLTDTSLLPLAAQRAGIAFVPLCEAIALFAAKRR